MSIPQEALKKMLFEMQTQVQQTRAELTACESQINRNRTNIKVADLTIAELEGTEEVWEGVGRAFFQTSAKTYSNSLNEDKRVLATQTVALEKKKHYYETTLEKTIDAVNKIIGQ
ncbi:unnamed protein product [Kuraishia capsulata CBS 1993]|uniref:Prefoldin subunit 1 n=1 Tax=Kuraishia capsulata CBS 1993 TaxID=1382522 RepID=W6MU58_9ASCO|nr:uncharacterized protein KUCA_T00001415001 [Kuraishia capsulata CBS 1993]CDK25445.1 unnamed protein product [Kuraishia capsulata CBS 1993]